ncbi:ATP-binding protein [Actinomadura rudentiformis]|uniref:ATP-binding protein n=1 Tax=Actinomadura rudentiformis TaxID=359158 RepID=A0A6H9Z5M6_9ACTN|nr:ATP-binding protein [Actinomadura rudentiformis]KAB2352598.1 ATP-binding protein [Actinomadura rudentiformis]
MAEGMAPGRKAGRRWGDLQGDLLEVRELAQWLREQIDAAGLTLRKLEMNPQIPYSRDVISRLLSGRERPDFEFVRLVVTACIPKDEHGRQVLLDRADALWKAANPATAHPYPPSWTKRQSADRFAARTGSAGIDAAAAAELDWSGHFAPRARGVEYPTERGSYFVGRQRAISELTEWLTSAGHTWRSVVVTGAPGSGKSALLGHLLSRSRAATRR